MAQIERMYVPVQWALKVERWVYSSVVVRVVLLVVWSVVVRVDKKVEPWVDLSDILMVYRWVVVWDVRWVAMSVVVSVAR